MDTYQDVIKRELITLSEKGRILFGALTTERLYPNYIHFEKMVGWGDHSKLQGAISLLYEYLLREDLVAVSEIQDAINEVDFVTPHTDDFPGITTSFALDACTSVHSTLSYILDKNIEHIIDVAIYARDTVDMYIQEIHNLDSQNPDFETKIATDPFMIAEKKRQIEVIRDINGITGGITSDLIRGIRNMNPIIDVSLLPM